MNNVRSDAADLTPFQLSFSLQPLLNLALPSFQLYLKEREAKLQVDILCNETTDDCSVSLSRLDSYGETSQCIPDNMKERIKELCICSQ